MVTMMELEELNLLVKQGESETLEFKRSTGERIKAAKTICAMLNKDGGKVLFGVRQHAESREGIIEGQQVSDRTMVELSNEFSKLEPPYTPDIRTCKLCDERAVIVVSVLEGEAKPYCYDGRYYKKVGPTTVPMPRPEYERMIANRLSSTNRWESQIAAGFEIGDLNITEITRTLDAAITALRAEDPGTRDPKELLRGLGLLNSEELVTRAAVVLFGREERLLPSFTQCTLKLARFKGTDKSEFIDNRQYQGNAFEILIRADRFLRDHLPIAGRIVPNLFEREDDPLYPPAALREALANALVHRDYTDPGGSVDIAIYDDRTEITNTGRLPEGITIADLYREHQSRPRNPSIARIFYLRRLIESWGRGTRKIVELCALAGHPQPVFEEGLGNFTVRFLPSAYYPPQTIRHDLTSRQRDALAFVDREGPVALSQISQFLQVNRKTVADDLQLLKSFGLLTSEGHGRGAKWRRTL